jgi:acyl dehydratase
MNVMHVELSRIGRWTGETTFAVDAAQIRAYASATNDEHALHTAGVVAPPLFACVPIANHIPMALDGLIEEEDRQRGLHSEQDMIFHDSIAPEMALRTQAAVIGVHPRLSGTAVIIKTETRHPDGALVNEQYATLFFRRRMHGRGTGEHAPDHRTPPDARTAARSSGQMLTAAQAVDQDQTFRYAEASLDRNPIHLDAEFARSVGLPGIIVHGMCTLAFTSRAVIRTVCGDDPHRLRRLAVRFARPVFPGQTITTHIWPAGAREGRGVHGFETLNPDGKAVIQDGLAEVDLR